MTSSIIEMYSYALLISWEETLRREVRRRAFLLVVFEAALFPDAQLLFTAKGFQRCLYTAAAEDKEIRRKKTIN